MKTKSTLALVTLVILIITSKALALGVGDAAPEIKVLGWLKGDAITKLETNKTYVIEFCASWCAPCRSSIPHLTEMAHKYKGNVIFIGMDTWEPGLGRTLEHKRTLVKQMCDKMDFSVAGDAIACYMNEAWMFAAHQYGIPTAFLVTQGRIAWIGHPMEGLEGAIEEVLSGKFDFEKARERAMAAEKEARQPTKTEQKLKAFTDKCGSLRSAAYEAELEKMTMEIDAQDTMLPNGQEFAVAESLRQGQMFIVGEKYLEAILDGNKEDAAKLGKRLGDMNIKAPLTQNNIAWQILACENVRTRDLALATKLAKAAVDATEGQDAAFIDTYAHALFDSGKTADAVEQQKKAIAVCKSDSMKSELEATLKKYEASSKPTGHK